MHAAEAAVSPQRQHAARAVCALQDQSCFSRSLLVQNQVPTHSRKLLDSLLGLGTEPVVLVATVFVSVVVKITLTAAILVPQITRAATAVETHLCALASSAFRTKYRCSPSVLTGDRARCLSGAQLSATEAVATRSALPLTRAELITSLAPAAFSLCFRVPELDAARPGRTFAGVGAPSLGKKARAASGPTSPCDALARPNVPTRQ